MKLYIGDRPTMHEVGLNADASVAPKEARPGCAGATGTDAAPPTLSEQDWDIALLTEFKRIGPQAQTCKKPGGPTGIGMLIVRMQPSRGVIGMEMEEPFAGTAVGACVADLFRAACVPPFVGDERSMLTTFVIE
jgi:hypothetical protein